MKIITDELGNRPIDGVADLMGKRRYYRGGELVELSPELLAKMRREVVDFRQANPGIVAVWEAAAKKVLPPPVTREEMVAAKGTDKQPEVVARIDAYIEALASLSGCRCNVKGCDPSGVPECFKGIRERRELP